MRGSTVDQVRQDIEVSEKVSNQIRGAEMAAGMQPLSPPKEEADAGGLLWFAVGAGISTAIIAVAVAVT